LNFKQNKYYLGRKRIMRNKISESELEISELLEDIKTHNKVDNEDKKQRSTLLGEEVNESILDQNMNVTVVKDEDKSIQVPQQNSKINFSLKKENIKLQEKLKKANHRIDNMNKQINNQKKQIEKYKNQLNDLELCLKKQKESTSYKKFSKKETERLKDVLSHTENRKNNLETELNNYIKEVNLLREDLSTAYLELAEIRGRLSKYEQIDTIACSIENELSKIKSGKKYISAIIQSLRKHKYIKY